MSALTFNALIGPVNFDPKKGAMKITLIAASHVSMDKLTSLGPADESVKITLESAQTKITGSPLVPGAEVVLEGGEEWLKKAAEELRGEDAEEADNDEEDEEEEEEEDEEGDELI